MNKITVSILLLVFLVSVTSLPAYAVDSNIEDDDRYWVGQELEYEVDSDSSNAELYISDDDVDVPFVTELDIDNNGDIIIDTEGYDENQYRLEYDDEFDNNKEVIFNLTEQDFDVNYESEDVSNEINSEIDVNYDSNRNNYNINVSSNDLDDDEISDIFGYSENDVEDGKLTIDESDDIADFEDISSGTYDIKYNVTDTDASENAEIEVISGDSDKALEFNKSVYTVDRGSEVNIGIDFTGVEETNIVIGGDDVGYKLDFDVEDTEDNGEVSVVFDTYEAGLDNTDDVIEIHDDSEGDIDVNSETEIDVDRLAPLDYDIQGYVDSIPVEFGTISISDIKMTGIETYSYPSDKLVDDIDEIKSASESEKIAENDTLIIELQGSVHSLVDEDTNLDNSTEDLDGLYVNLVSRSPNSDDNVELEDADIYTEPADSKTYVVQEVNSSKFEIGEELEIEAGLTKENDYIEDEEDEIELTEEIDIVDRDTSFEDYNNQEDKIELPSDGILTATTNLADQTEKVLVIKETGSNPDIYNYDVTALNGKFTANISGDIDVGDTFTAEIVGETDTVDGEMIEKDTNEDSSDEKDNSDAIENPDENTDEDSQDEQDDSEENNENSTNEGQNNEDQNNGKNDNSSENEGGIFSSIISFFDSLF